ncbi:MAG: PAS domain-containing protein, partial [Leptospira sp.]|nr:PAS domain-containing protein [Leptospira sp.]
SNEEINSLFKDMLIGVTNFFRDSESFKSLEETIIPKLFTGKNSGATIRIWCAGCSTGEEAYSIAILMLEYMEYLKQNFHIQIFATDIDPRAIATARSGIYPKSITADINQERIERYFSSIPNGREDGLDSYQINKNIRDMLIFSEQNIIKDPPFSRLDLISCRNLMIYLSNELQKKLIPLFHYALNPNAFLFLGTSESVSDYTDLFQSLDRKSKIYLRKENQSNVRKALIEDYYPSLHRQGNLSSGLATQKPSKRDFSPRQIAEQTLLKQLAPSSALVNSQGDIFYLHGRTGIFLEPAVGEVNGYNILKMAREGLRYEIATALRKSVMNKEIIRFTNLNVKTNGNYTNINLTICPAIIDVNNPLSELMYLVILEETNSSIQVKKDLLLPIEEIDEGIQVHNTKLIESLRSELRAKEDYLQSTTEELETANEELKSYNEEMQSVNEELQSTNEELETSKEELQSVNEELITVNNELSQKVSDLSRTNNDMNNLLAGTGIATIFVDFQLNILRFTPSASELINVISGDIGRPVNHILSKFSDYDNLALDIQSVFDTLIPKVIEVQTLIGKWFRMNILPYRTLENVIEGAVITFVDISETRRFQIDLEKREKLLKVSQRMSKVGGWEWDIDNQMMYWTEEMYTIHGFSKGKEWSDKDEPIKRSLNCFNPEDHQTILDSFQRCIDLEQPYDISLPFTSEKGNKLWVRVTGHPESKNGKVIRVIGNIMDITDSKNAEDEIKRQLSEKETLLKEVHHRIKNNIVSIESLLSLQINSSTSAIVKEALQESLSRIQSMSVLYDKLFLGNDYQEVSSKFYIESLIDAIFAVFSESKNITFKNSISDFPLNSKTVIPLGIIINELLTNIFKYSFPSKVNNHIDIVLTKIDQNVTLIIKDNGIGIDEEIINSKSTGFGLKIVEMLTRQLGGKYTVKNENGTMNTLIFKI